MEISVIVIVYNAAGLLPRCLDSILGQRFRDFELLVVDDGSTDGTAAILDAYAKKDARIRPYHQSNQGPAKARQQGLDLACGRWSIFVDADDWIEPDMLEQMYGKACSEKADIVFCDFVEENGKGTFYRKEQPAGPDSADVMKQMLTTLHGSLCNKLISKELYQRSGARFLDGLNYCEDELLVIRLLHAGCRVAYVGKGFYHYDKTANTASLSNLWACRPVSEYELFIQNCAPYFDTPELRKNLDERTAQIIKKLTYAPKDSYQAARAFYKRHRQALWHSGLSLPRKLFCILYFNGFRFISQVRESYQSNISQ